MSLARSVLALCCLLALLAVVPAPGAAAAAEHPAVERDGGEVVLSVPADRIDGEESVPLTVAAVVEEESAGPTAEVTADRRGGHYVARLPVTDLVGSDPVGGLENATVRASVEGSVVLSDGVDLRYVARRDRPTFDGTTLVLPADVRGVGDAGIELALAETDRRLAADLDGRGPNATLAIPADRLRGVPVAQQLQVTVLADGEPVPGDALTVSVAEAAGRASSLAYRDGNPVVRQPLLHPAIGPERVDLRIDTRRPAGTYLRAGASVDGTLPVPEDVPGASGRRLTVTGGGTTLVEDVRLSAPGRPTVALRIQNGSLLAPDPGALEGYDAVVLRDDHVATIPIGAALREGAPQSLPADLGAPEESGAGGSTAGGATAGVRASDAPAIGQSATAILVGEGVPPARVDLTVVVAEAAPESDGPAAPDASAFVGLWVDVGAGVALLVFAMVGAVAAVGAGFLVRVASPARSAAAGGRAVVGHFLLGGVGGVATIIAVQALYTGPVVGSVRIGGVSVGIGALLVGSFHGGLTAVGLRVGLGTAGIWPTRSIVGRTVPVHVHVADDGGNPLPGTPTVAVQRERTATVLTTAAVEGTTATLALPPDEYRVIARTGQREVDPVALDVPEPETVRPEPVEVDLTVGRPSLQVEVTDARTDSPVPSAAVTVTTDREETRSVEAAEGSARVALPLATGAVTVVVDAERYERTVVDQPIDEQLTTLDVALEPTTGRLDATALVDDQPMDGASVLVEPAEADPPPVGERIATLETDEAGEATVELPVGAYRLRLDLDGPNARYFEVTDAVVDVESGDATGATVRASFEWTIPEQHRQRAGRIRETIRSVGTEATADPTIPLYFAAVADELLGVLAALPASGALFADAAHDPDEVAAATVDAAGATLQAVGRSMQADGVAPVLAAGGEPVQVRPDVDASPAALLAHLGEDVAVATVETRESRVRERFDAEADRLPTVAPVRAVASVAVRLPRGVDSPLQVASREFAALCLLDAAEECLDHAPIRQRLAAAEPAADARPAEQGDPDDPEDGEALEEAD